MDKGEKEYRSKNKFDLTGEYGIGWTRNTNAPFYFDLEDFDKINQYTWSERLRKVTDKTVYHMLRANVKGKVVNMHTYLGFKGYDHINRNPLDNRRCNLRKTTEVTNSQNRGLRVDNKTGVTGVWYNEEKEVWYVSIMVNKKQHNLGVFTDLTEAIKTRLKAEKEYFGEFAPQQHLFEQYEIN